MSSIFKTALGISILAHTAIIAPYTLKPFMDNKPEVTKSIELNYIVIEKAHVAQKEEVYANEPFEKESGGTNSEFLQPEDISSMENILPEEAESKKDSLKREEKVFSVNQEAFLEYFNLVREKVRAKIHGNLYRQEEGIVTLSLTLAPDGRIQTIDSNVIGSALKIKAEKGLREAQPFPPFPKEMGAHPMNFSLTIQFK
ncbi:MAG: energy transducer TonB [Candidatus Omnitrophica bacterium]|nr:energy transducer TonB [Candidatus Omnitrophota bacterium]